MASREHYVVIGSIPLMLRRLPVLCEESGVNVGSSSNSSGRRSVNTVAKDKAEANRLHEARRPGEDPGGTKGYRGPCELALCQWAHP